MNLRLARKTEKTPEEITRPIRELVGALTPEEKAESANQRLQEIEAGPLAAGIGRTTLTGDPGIDSSLLRQEFHIRLIELADQFDHLDHEFGPFGGGELQDDCQAVRQLTRREMHPRFQEVFRDQRAGILDAEILAGLVAGPDANK